jgi:exosortase
MQRVKNHKIALGVILAITGVIVIYYYGFAAVYSELHNRKSAVIPWMVDSWRPRNDLIHGYVIPFLFVTFVMIAWKDMRKDLVSPSWWGSIFLVVGLMFYVVSVRVIQPRLAIIGLPFLIVGAVQFVCGTAVAKRMLFPSFFWYFAVPVPGIRQATNFLQVWVTESCYTVGTFFGMKLINAGNEIRSATDDWDALNIAEGCSGIRSLMALVMVSAIYAYLTQKQVWKMVFLFACSLPLALLANFFRIFTIVVLAELGFSEFAAGAYHDWAGLLFFFPIALAGLFIIDKLLNWKENRKVVRVRTQE